MSSKILVLPGDGIGVEVADQAIRVIDKLNDHGLEASYEKDCNRIIQVISNPT